MTNVLSVLFPIDLFVKGEPRVIYLADLSRSRVIPLTGNFYERSSTLALAAGREGSEGFARAQRGAQEKCQ